MDVVVSVMRVKNGANGGRCVSEAEGLVGPCPTEVSRVGRGGDKMDFRLFLSGGSLLGGGEGVIDGTILSKDAEECWDTQL